MVNKVDFAREEFNQLSLFLFRILPAEESLSLTSFFCHGENIFVQLETTAPPPRRRSRKKRGIRFGNILLHMSLLNENLRPKLEIA